MGGKTSSRESIDLGSFREILFSFLFINADMIVNWSTGHVVYICAVYSKHYLAWSNGICGSCSSCYNGKLLGFHLACGGFVLMRLSADIPRIRKL